MGRRRQQRQERREAKRNQRYERRRERREDRRNARLERITARQQGRTDRVELRQNAKMHKFDKKAESDIAAYEAGFDPNSDKTEFLQQAGQTVRKFFGRKDSAPEIDIPFTDAEDLGINGLAIPSPQNGSDNKLLFLGGAALLLFLIFNKK